MIGGVSVMDEFVLTDVAGGGKVIYFITSSDLEFCNIWQASSANHLTSEESEVSRGYTFRVSSDAMR
jgi:hypothetical protein